MTPADVLKFIKEKEAKFADLRFTDTLGKEQHVTIPARLVDEDFFTRRQDVRRLFHRRLEGHQRVGHDPDARRRHRGHRSVLRRDHRQHPLRCHRADDHAGLRARPALARQARRGLPQVDRHRRLARLFGPENEFFIFDSVRFGSEMHGCFYEVDSVQGAWNSRQGLRGRQQGPPPRRQGRLLPGAAGRCIPGHPHGDVPGAARRWA